MMHPDLLHLAAAQFQLADQFHADGAAGGSKLNVLQQRPADQPVVAVDVADFNPKQQPRAEIVNIAYPDTMRRVMPLQLVTVDQAGLRTYELEQSGQFPYVVLPVAVGV